MDIWLFGVPVIRFGGEHLYRVYHAGIGSARKQKINLQWRTCFQPTGDHSHTITADFQQCKICSTLVEKRKSNSVKFFDPLLPFWQIFCVNQTSLNIQLAGILSQIHPKLCRPYPLNIQPVLYLLAVAFSATKQNHRLLF